MVATPHMLHWDCPRPEGVATLAFATRGQEYWKQNGNACSPVSLADRTRATRRASAWGFPWQRRLRRRTARDCCCPTIGPDYVQQSNGPFLGMLLRDRKSTRLNSSH